MLECNLHNVLFYDVEPRAIHCISYEDSSRKLALSRSDNSVEVWDVAHAPHVQCVIPSRPNDSVEALAWCEGRLLSVGQLGYVREYDLQRLCVKHDLPVTTGPAWCIDVNRHQTQLAVGTENGYINIFEVSENILTFVKILDKQEGRILCIAWDPSGQMVVTGGIDVIRIWNVKSGQAVHRLVAGRSSTNKETVVWCVAVTHDFTIITGDSRGFLTFWDGNIGTQMDAFCSHKADVLTLCVDKEENTVYCAGVDPVIVSFKLVTLKGGSKNQWVRSIERRVHSHDVRAMVLTSNKHLYSGGVDSYLVMSSYPPKVAYKYPPTLQRGRVQLCGESRCLLLCYPGRLEVWQLGRAEPSQEKGTLPLAQEPIQLLQLSVRPGEFLQCAALSPDCLWLAYSTASDLRLFSLPQTEGDVPELQKSKFQGKEREPCHAMVFSTSSQFAVLASNAGSLDVYQMCAEGAVWLCTIHSSSERVLGDVVKLLALSSDDKYFAAGDCRSNIVIWSTATWQVQCVLPRRGCAPTAMCFHRSKHLVVVYADQKVVEVVLKNGKFSKFSKQLSRKVPEKWWLCAFPITNVTFDPRNDKLVILHDDSALCVVNKYEEVEMVGAKVARRSSLGLSDSQDDIHSKTRQQQFTFHHRKFKHLVHAEWLGEDELVVVNVRPESLAAKLPPTFKKKTYGM